MTCGAKLWTLTNKIDRDVMAWEGNTLRKTLLWWPIFKNVYRRTEFKFLSNLSVIKLRVLEWLDLGVRVDGERTLKKLLEDKQGGGRRKVRSRLRWMDDVETNFRNVGVKLLRTSVLDRIE